MSPTRPLVRNSKAKYITAGVAAGLILFVAVLAFGSTTSRLGNLPSSPSAPQNEYVESIANGVISVDAGGYEYREFEVPSDASTSIVRGSFHVVTDIGEHIRLMIFDQEEFVNWQTNRYMGENQYYSGEVTTANLEDSLPAGQRLYLVFDNTFSLDTAKNVDADIELFYRR